MGRTPLAEFSPPLKCPRSAGGNDMETGKMTYDLSPRLFVEDGPAVSAAAVRSSAHHRSWRKLDRNRRLALIEKALKAAANDRFDDLPIAL